MNVEKSELKPKQIFNFVGYQFDLQFGRVRPTPDRWQNLQDKILALISLPACLVREFTSSFAMVAERRQCPHRPAITSYATCSANLYRRIKRRVGRSLKRVNCQRNLVTTRKQTAYKLLGTKSSLSGSKRVPKAMHGQNGSDSNRQYHSSGLHQQGGRHEVGPTLCPTLENLDLVYRETSDSEGPTHSRPPKCGGRQTVQIGTDCSNRMVPPSRGFSSPVQQVAPASDLFATRFNNKVPLFVSPVPDPMATAVDALSLSWEDLDAYAFPPTRGHGGRVVTLASHLCDRGSIPVMAVSGKAGSCLPLVGSLQYTTLANSVYWFPLPFQLPVVI